MFETLVHFGIAIGWIVIIIQALWRALGQSDSTKKNRTAPGCTKVVHATAPQHDALAAARHMYRDDPAMIEALEKRLQDEPK